jgi:hypothetical protein
MAFEAEKTRTQASLLDRASPLLQLIALFGIPAAGCVALVLFVQIPRFLYGQAVPLFLAAEICGLLTMIVLLFVLRACLALPGAPLGFYRNVLDFLAMAGWHPSVKAALAGLIVLPPLWYIRADHYWLIDILRTHGHRALKLGDVQSSLDGVAVSWQLAMTGGVPLLFALHMLSRWKPKSRVLPWVLVPLLFVGTVIAVVLLVAIMHPSY